MTERTGVGIEKKGRFSRLQILLIVSLLGYSWLGMQMVHELGHVTGAKLTGGVVSRVILNPLVISQTRLSHNPHPLIVAWSGPIFGVVLPLFMMMTAKHLRCPGNYLFRFFAGFCLIANGAYIGVGSFYNVADPGDIMTHGSPQWVLILYGVVASASGLYLWNHQGVHFGMGDAKGRVDKNAAIVSMCVFLVIFTVEMVFAASE